ncbi:carbohydrate kinase [Levilactobacillus brevis]|uniref:L-xylulose-3-keto-L-gulonate kinase n=1 Tax=Levilactobacillus brevis TaxID=1580 RepID=A0A5B7Y2M4_LEVBR|nr:FGGY-family carbohydrate kinase [Levilactobacillus brevis]KIO94087.1 Carbohydrate kinase, FGGY family [Levilactobacillus brevis]KIP00825.1 Carbohydrate kinase, FGGY family [Levilactobacillus brevis]OLF66532.1 carbohydrate kinase [Levilactobacillus brevis]QCZ54258.1 L-xylulose-3-keto-L-gulonate kinase [Levilactobacillus brevis]
MTSYFLTIDNGGTNTKVAIFDDQGKQIAVSAFPTKNRERQAGFHEANLADLWQALGTASRDALQRANLTGDQISGVTTVGHGKGLYVLDRQHHIFMDGILSADSRAEKYAINFEKRIHDIYAISHQHVMASQAPVLLRWLKDHEPENYRQIGAVLSNKDFIRFLLTGEVCQEVGDASGNHLLNLETADYDPQILAFFGIPEMANNLPQLIQATDQCGVISAEAAEVTGIQAGTPVFGGMFDIDACAIATGVLDNDKFSLIAGTWNMNIFPNDTMASEASGLMNSIFPTGKRLIEASSPTSAGNLAIMIKLLMTAELRDAQDQGKSIYDDLEVFLANTDATFAKLIYFPFLYGSNTDPEATGSFIGLRSNTTKSEMLRAVYEGIAFAHRYHVQALLKVLGHQPSVIRMSGGGTNSPSWVQMFANILNIPIELVSSNELGGLGGAMTSAVGIGLYPDLETAAAHMSRVKARYEPQADQVKIYDQKYTAYLSLLTALKGNWTALKEFQEGAEQ